jgi:hypothetical protein
METARFRTAIVALLIAGLIVAAGLAGRAARPAAPTTAAESVTAVDLAPRSMSTLAVVQTSPAQSRCDPNAITGDMVYGSEGSSGGSPKDVYQACAQLNR